MTRRGVVSSGIQLFLGACISITSPIALAQDRLVVQQVPAEIGRGTDTNSQVSPSSTSDNATDSADNGPPVVSLLIADGSWRVGRLDSVGVEGWRLAVRTATGVENQRIPASDAIAFVVRRSSLRPALGSEAESRSCAEGSLLQVAPLSLGLIDTIDGQRLPGTFRVVNGRAVWDHRWIGSIPISLDRVSSLRMIPDRSAPASSDADTVLLLNGDLVRGFIDGIAEDVALSPLDPVDGDQMTETDRLNQRSGDGDTAPRAKSEEQPSDQRQETTEGSRGDSPGDTRSSGETRDQVAGNVRNRRIAMDRIAAIALADMPIEARTGIDIWTADGSIVGADALSFVAPLGWSFVLGSDWLRSIRSQPTSDNQAADPLAGVLDRGRFMPLAACALRTTDAAEPLGYRYRSEQPARVHDSARYLLSCTEIEIDGPSSVSFAVPEVFRSEGTVLTGMVSIVEPSPADVRVEIVISFGASSTERITLDGTRRCQPFILRSNGASTSVTISVADGGNGVAGDRIVLERTALIAPQS